MFCDFFIFFSYFFVNRSVAKNGSNDGLNDILNKSNNDTNDVLNKSNNGNNSKTDIFNKSSNGKHDFIQKGITGSRISLNGRTDNMNSRTDNLNRSENGSVRTEKSNKSVINCVHCNSNNSLIDKNINQINSNKKLPPPVSIDENTMSAFDKVNIPYQFVGKTFGLLFRCLYETEGAICIALYRWRQNEKSEKSKAGLPQARRVRLAQKVHTELPSVLTCPGMDTVLLMHDEVFILRATHRHM